MRILQRLALKVNFKPGEYMRKIFFQSVEDGSEEKSEYSECNLPVTCPDDLPLSYRTRVELRPLNYKVHLANILHSAGTGMPIQWKPSEADTLGTR